MKILFAASEVHPLIKTGGLGDVAGALPVELARLEPEVRLILPAYSACKARLDKLTEAARLRLSSEAATVRVLEGQLPGGDIRVWLVDSPKHFERPGNPYTDENGQDWPDNAARFTIFCRAIAVLVHHPGFSWQPDIIHCNDWQTGLVPALLPRQGKRPATLFTVHNLSYQGVFPYEDFKDLALPAELWSPAAFEFHRNFSFIKGGLLLADRLTTVSPTYAKEILTPVFGCGLDDVLQERAGRLSGILNGANYHHWNPASDTFIEQNYDQNSRHRKISNKLALQRDYGLRRDEATPLLGFIGRLVEQKGVDLILDALPQLLAEKIQLVFLGEGDKEYEDALQALALRYPRQIGVSVSYSEPLAHRIQAGADIFLMPSRFEPCGLTQLYALRYGTVPVVHRTGGLADTVVNASGDNLQPGRATGFLFDKPVPDSLLTAIRQALALYEQRGRWRELALNGMAQDFSWQSSAQAYLKLYRRMMAA